MAPCQAIRDGVDACPFLRRVAETQGDDFAARFAVNPFRPVGNAPRAPIFPEEESAFRTSVQLFHGARGPVPLPKFAAPSAERCAPAAAAAADAAPRAAAPLPFAAIGLGRGPFSRGGKPDRNSGGRPSSGEGPSSRSRGSSRPSSARGPSSSSSSSSRPHPNGGAGGGLSRPPRSMRPRHAGTGPARGPGRAAPLSGASAPPSSGPSSRPSLPARSSSRCPVHRMLNGLAKLSGAGKEAVGEAAAKAGPSRALAASSSAPFPLASMLALLSGTAPGRPLRCPAPVARARAAVARLPPVRALRPRSFAARLAGAAALAMVANVPAGALRERAEKRSLAWFLAVHAAVPFVAALRKALALPPAAVAATVGASVAGQALGARAVRRVAQAAAQGGRGQDDAGLAILRLLDALAAGLSLDAAPEAQAPAPAAPAAPARRRRPAAARPSPLAAISPLCLAAPLEGEAAPAAPQAAALAWAPWAGLFAPPLVVA